MQRIAAPTDIGRTDSRRVRDQSRSGQPTRANQDQKARVFAPAPTSTFGAIRAARAACSWYLARFASAQAKDTSDQRRYNRWGLRGLLRQEAVSALPRVARCGLPIGNSHVAIHRGDSDVTHTSGVETCGSIWSCPVCAAKIRNERAEEIKRGLMHHISLRGGRGGVLLATF